MYMYVQVCGADLQKKGAFETIMCSAQFSVLAEISCSFAVFCDFFV